jgi:hypothetical protein
MHATALVESAIQAWEEKDANALASYLSDDVICKQILPQSIGKAQLLAFMKAITIAFPDWSFNGHVLSQSPPARSRRLASGLHRNSAYRLRRAALASLSDVSGHIDKVPVLIQSCRTRSVLMVTFLAPTRSACSLY